MKHKIAEIKISYKPKKLGEGIKITDSEKAYQVLFENWNNDSIQLYEEFKKDTGTDFWRDYTLGQATFEDLQPYNLHVSSERLNELQANGYRSFYFRPKSIWRKLVAVRSFSELYRLATAARSLI